MSINSLINVLNPTNDELQLLSLRNILSKKSEERDPDDLDFVAQYIYNLKYFQNIVSKEDERFEFAKGCAKYLKYELHPQGSEVFRKGDKGQNFYIILNGEASVFIPKTDDEVERDSKNESKAKVFRKYTEFVTKSVTMNELPTETRLTPRRLTFNGRSKSLALNKAGASALSSYLTQMNSLSRLILSKENPVLQEEVKDDLTYEEKLLFLNNTKQETDPYFIRGTAIYKKVNSLKKGDFFGELALIFNQPRLASIIAGEDLHLLSLKSSSYKAVFQSEIQNTLEKTKLFRGFFPNTSQDDIGKFCYLIEEKSFKFNDVIYREGDEVEAFYIIQQGEIQLSRYSKTPFTEKGNIGRRGSLSQRRIIAATLGAGNFFGDFEVINKSKMKYTALCTSSTLVYKLTKKKYFGIIESNFPQIAKVLKDQAIISEKHRNSRIETSEKIQFSAFAYEEMEATEQQIEHAKNVEIKMRKVFRRTSETIPLHFKPKYESFGFKEEEENEQNNNKKSDHKISHFNSSQIIHPIFSPRESRRSFVNTIVSNGEHISTPTALNALKENLFSFGSPKSSTSPSRKLKILLPASSETSETKSTPHTPNSYSAGLAPKSKLSKLISQKSSFSGVSQEKPQEDQVPSARNHLRESSLFSNKKKDTEENTPTSFTNTFSPRSDKIQDPSRLLSGSRRFQSIFASAFQSTPQTSPRKTLKSNRSEEKLVHNIHIAAKVEQDKAMKLNKMRPSFAKIKTRGSMTERRKSEDVPRLEPLHLSKPFENEVNLDIKQIKNLDNLGEFKEFIIRKGVHGQELKKQRNRPQFLVTKNN